MREGGYIGRGREGDKDRRGKKKKNGLREKGGEGREFCRERERYQDIKMELLSPPMKRHRTGQKDSNQASHERLHKSNQIQAGETIEQAP